MVKIARQESDIARNVRTIEWLKAEMMSEVAGVFKALLKNSEEAIVDGLANIIIAAYLLGKRLGISFSRLDMKISTKVKANIDKAHEIEKWYGDFSSLSRYLEEKQQ